MADIYADTYTDNYGTTDTYADTYADTYSDVYGAAVASTATVRLARLEVTTVDETPDSQIRLSRLEVSAASTAQIRLSRLEVSAGSLVGRWIIIDGVDRQLGAVQVVAGGPVDPTYTAPDYGPIGSYQPGASTTGTWRPLTQTISGNVTISTPNVVYRDTLFDAGEIHFEPGGTDALFQNCRFNGITGTGPYGNVVGRGGSGFSMFGARFEDCYFTMTEPTDRKANLYGCGYTAVRCEIEQGVDGFSVVGTAAGTLGDITIAGCWVHNCWYGATTTQPDGFTHNDGIQLQQQGTGSHIAIYGNYIGGVRDPADKAASDDWNNAAIIIQQETSSADAYRISNVDIYDNWFHGGASRINLGYKFSNNLAGVRVGPNKYIRSTWSGGGGYYIVRMNSVAASISAANVYSDTGAAVPIQVNADA